MEKVRTKKISTIAFIAIILSMAAIYSPAFGARYMENLNRGIVAVSLGGAKVYVSWRLLGTDPQSTAFNLYRNGTKVNATPISTVTNYTDTAGSTSAVYYVKPVINGVEDAQSETTTVWGQFYMSIPISAPPGGTTPDGVTYTYTANDCSVGDLDGDGEYEIVLKWDPTNSKDNSQSGYTGDVYIDAYKLNGKFMWRIDLGKNIRAGAHYTQFMVYDLDSDGKAEMACKTAPGTIDGTGNYLSTGPAATDNDGADYRNSSGYILSGPEYLTVFNGMTGKEMATVNYNPPRGTVSDWGDSYGNRVDRFLACVAYLDGVHPSLVMCRGYYTRTTLAAWDFNGTTLTQRWFFDSNTAGSPYAEHVDGLGNHNLSVGDVNGDGYDEIVYGPMAIDHNGKAMYDTMLGHGDAMHLGKFLPDRPGLQVWDIHENYPLVNGGGELHDAATGEILWGVPNTGDTGRGLAADIDPNYRGAEMWSPMTGGVESATGTLVSATEPSTNFRIYWDGDLQDELLDGTKLDKWTGNGTTRLETFYNYAGAIENNGTKATPCLVADILGDWREEVVYRSSDNTKLLIFTTTTPSNYRFYTLMQDPEYRLSIAWQNVAYNQPPHVSFYLGDGPSAQPTADIILAGLAAMPTPALTPSATMTVPATITYTRTWTSTATMTTTFTPTATRTVTITLTATPSATQSFTSTIKIPTGTVTQTCSLTPQEPTQTETYTRFATSTVFTTPAFSATPTDIPSSTAIVFTPSFTDTITATSTQLTSSQTVTETATATDTKTPQIPSLTITPSFTETFTATRTWTGTPSSTDTLTATPTGTGTATVTASETFINTENITSTPSATPAEASLSETPVLYPNPYIASEGNLKIDFYARTECGEIEFKLYTSSFRLVLAEKLDGDFIGKSTAEISSKVLARFASGSYYYAVYTESASGSGKRMMTGVLIILR